MIRFFMARKELRALKERMRAQEQLLRSEWLRISEKTGENGTAEQIQLYAAAQALSWALNANCAKSPVKMITDWAATNGG